MEENMMDKEGNNNREITKTTGKCPGLSKTLLSLENACMQGINPYRSEEKILWQQLSQLPETNIV